MKKSVCIILMNQRVQPSLHLLLLLFLCKNALHQFLLNVIFQQHCSFIRSTFSICIILSAECILHLTLVIEICGRSIDVPESDCSLSLGVNCNRCADNFFGNPNVPGGTCEPCACNNNIDSSLPGSCDPATGQCLKCLYNTEGAQCERCKTGFYGDARRQNCRR